MANLSKAQKIRDGLTLLIEKYGDGVYTCAHHDLFLAGGLSKEDELFKQQMINLGWHEEESEDGSWAIFV